MPLLPSPPESVTRDAAGTVEAEDVPPNEPGHRRTEAADTPPRSPCRRRPSRRTAPPLISPPVQASVAGLAIASMVLGIVWIYWIGSILAIIFGHVALSQIKKSNGWKTGRGMAIAGVVLGYVGLGTLILVIILAIGARNSTSRIRIDTDRPNGICTQSRFLEDPDC